jgi:hypothetical protein
MGQGGAAAMHTTTAKLSNTGAVTGAGEGLVARESCLTTHPAHASSVP